MSKRGQIDDRLTNERRLLSAQCQTEAAAREESVAEMGFLVPTEGTPYYPGWVKASGTCLSPKPHDGLESAICGPEPLARRGGVTACYNHVFMVEFVLALLAALRVFFRSRGASALEILALRQPVAVLKRRRPRPNLSAAERLFWTFLRGFGSR